MQHMPNGDEHLSCHSHQDLHLVLFSHLRLMVREPAEEAVLRPAGCPCTLYDCLAEIYISVSYAPRLDFCFLSQLAYNSEILSKFVGIFNFPVCK